MTAVARWADWPGKDASSPAEEGGEDAQGAEEVLTLEQSPSQDECRHLEVDDEAGDVYEGGDERGG